MFNEQEYANANPDLPGSWTDDQFQYHFNAFGFAEGRDVYWSATDYISLNTDLAGMTDEEAFSHWVSFGKGEGRVPWFQADEYITANGDLVGMTDAEALSHWTEYGMDEGRLQGFDSAGYLELNDDVPQDWTFAEALNHYYQYGQDEGRAFDAYVDEAVVPPPEGTIVPVTEGDVTTLSLDTNGGAVTLTADDITVDGGDGTQILRLTGDASARIDLTDPADQVEGLDLNGDGLIASDGIENNLSNAGIMTVSNFEIFDAYARNPINETDHENNYFGDIAFDGTGFNGDGVNTDGNIYLGGLGVDTAFGGIGNDFMAGGGVAAGRFTPTGAVDFFGQTIFVDNLTGLETVAPGVDTLYGGRNADFFFAELSALDPTDGDNLTIDGGLTSDDAANGNNTPQDSDWLLVEASDDDEPVTITLTNPVTGENFQTLTTRSGVAVTMHEIENVDASGNLYGFLDDMNTTIGGKAGEGFTPGEGNENVGIGSSAQLVIAGSVANNILIGGFDNDLIQGDGGNDLIFGGRLDYLNNPNLVGIVNDGMDELFGGAGDDDIVFEADGGIIEGDNVQDADDGISSDTLWLTDLSLGTQAVADMTTDSTLRFDLLAENLDNAAGYGGADFGTTDNILNDTQDQTNYTDDDDRVNVQDMENIDATGLGAIDYLAAGTNDPELSFNNQQNLDGYNGNLDLRGDNNDNAIYSGGGDDVIEGREGNDDMMGNLGNDDFIFKSTGREEFIIRYVDGDDVDVIRRKQDVDNDGLWDGVQDEINDNTDAEFVVDETNDARWGQDFGLDQDSETMDSVLQISVTRVGGNAPGEELGDVVNQISEIRTGVMVDGSFVAVVLDTQAIQDARTYAALEDAINDALAETVFADQLTAELQADGVTIYISDTEGRELADDFLEVSAGVDVSQKANTQTENVFTFDEPDEILSQDRLIYKAYEDRLDNEGVDDDAIYGSTISLGLDSYAEDMVLYLPAVDENGDVVEGDGTRLAEDQQYTIQFENLTTEDVVTVSVNGVQYSLQVGYDLNGNLIDAENTLITDLVTIQTNFIARLSNYIQTFMDDDTAAGALDAAAAGDTLTLTQRAYDGEETVFMQEPLVDIENGSGGEGAFFQVENTSQHELFLYEFDGSNNALNAGNVLFIGEEGESQAVLATAADEGGLLEGLDADVVDVEDNIEDLDQNLTTQFAQNFAVHADDLLIGADGDDTINGLTGDDRVHGSRGDDTLDGGKDWYLVTMVGDDDGTLMALNDYDSAQQDADPDVASIVKILQTEDGNNLVDGFFDTLLYQQADFGSVGADGAQFTITLDNYLVDGDEILLNNGGAGTATVYENGELTGTTAFTNFENVRTVAGDGTLAGQGNDTLDVEGLSNDTGGVWYNLTLNGGQVFYDANQEEFDRDDDDTDGDLVERDWIEIFTVDGVEHVVGGSGEDGLNIDQTEAGKHNVFSAGSGDDMVVYASNFAVDMEPTVTLTVNAGTDTDTVMMTEGRVGLDETVDTLESVENIDFGNIADSDRADDVLDVTNVNDAVVDFVNSEIRSGGDMIDDEPDGSPASDDEVVNITGMGQFEIVNADYSDTVIVADNMVNANISNTNVELQFDTFLNYDMLNDATLANPSRMTVAELRATTSDGAGAFNNLGAPYAFGSETADEGDIPEAENVGLYTFNMGEDTDTVDYSDETGLITAVLDFEEDAVGSSYIMVSHDNDVDFTDNSNRVDILNDAEQVVASQGISILDFTSSDRDLKITFLSNVAEDNLDAADRLVSRVQVSDSATDNPLSRAYLEYYDAGNYDNAITDGQVITQDLAAWSRIEGSDNGETVIFQGSDSPNGTDHRFVSDTVNLRGGVNRVQYNDLETSISTVITVIDYDADKPLITGRFEVETTFQDGLGGNLAGGGTDKITSYTVDNEISAGSLRIDASKDAEDEVTFLTGAEKLFILGTSPGIITVQVGSSDTPNSMVLTGYEFLRDADSDDVYEMDDIGNVYGINGMSLIDNVYSAGDPTVSADDDTDTIKVDNQAIAFDGGPAELETPANTISLEVLNDSFAFDFDVLDITNITTNGLTITGDDDDQDDDSTLNAADVDYEGDADADEDGDADNPRDILTDKVILGDLSLIDEVNNFDILGLSEDSAGTSFDIDLDAGEFQTGTGTKLFDIDANGDLDGFDASLKTEDLTITLTETAAPRAFGLIGGSGDDQITGNGGDNTIAGGLGADILDGSLIEEQLETYDVELIDALANGDTVIFGGIQTNLDPGDTVDIWGADVLAQVAAGGTVAVGGTQTQEEAITFALNGGVFTNGDTIDLTINGVALAQIVLGGGETLTVVSDLLQAAIDADASLALIVDAEGTSFDVTLPGVVNLIGQTDDTLFTYALVTTFTDANVTAIAAQTQASNAFAADTVAYNADTDTFTLSFQEPTDAGTNDVTAAKVDASITEDVNHGAGNAIETQTFVDEAQSADTYVYNDAAESTSENMDTILNFNATDLLDFSETGIETTGSEIYGALLENNDIMNTTYGGFFDVDNDDWYIYADADEVGDVAGYGIYNEGTDMMVKLDDYAGVVFYRPAGVDGIVIQGTTGDDTLTGTPQDDQIFGGDGNDTINAGAGNDTIFGQDGDDIIDGEADNDEITGGVGNDDLTGGAGDDELYGQSGDDTLDGGTGIDELDGGTGADTFEFVSFDTGITAVTSDIIVDFETGIDSIDVVAAIFNYIEADGAANDEAAFLANAAASFAGGVDAYVEYNINGSNNAYVLIDEDGSGGVNAGDIFLTLMGVADNTDIDGADFI